MTALIRQKKNHPTVTI